MNNSRLNSVLLQCLRGMTAMLCVKSGDERHQDFHLVPFERKGWRVPIPEQISEYYEAAHFL